MGRCALLLALIAHAASAQYFRVLLEDGRKAPKQTMITCGATCRTISGPNGTMGCVPQGGDRPMSGRNRPATRVCTASIRLSGYQSRTFGVMPGTTNIVLRPVRGTEAVVSIFNLGAPPEAGKALEKGLEAAEARKWQDAEKHLTRAIEIHRDYPAAWHELGKVREAQGKPAAARMSHRQAVEIDPQYLPPYLALARLNTKAKRWDDVIAIAGFLLERSPHDHPLAWFYLCIAQYNLRDYEEAERSAREGIALRAHHEYPQLVHMLGLSLAHQRRFEEALRYLRQFVKMAPEAPDAPAAKELIADIEQNRKQ